MKFLDVTKKTDKPLRFDERPFVAHMIRYFNFYLQQVQPLIAQYGTQSPYGMHGLTTHTNAVVFRGIDYALRSRQSVEPVIFACAFHDMARINDTWDTEHGKRAVPMAMKIMKQFPDLLDAKTRAAILSAIINHTNGCIAPDLISGCLWDADRTRLSWEYGFNERFFNTPRGKFVASNNPKNYIEFQKKCFPGLVWGRQY